MLQATACNEALSSVFEDSYRELSYSGITVFKVNTNSQVFKGEFRKAGTFILFSAYY